MIYYLFIIICPIRGKITPGRITRKGGLSHIQNYQQQYARQTGGGLRTRWEKDIGPLEDIDWEAALMHPREVAIKARLRLIQYKVLHRIYYDKDKLHKMGSSDSPYCPTCKTV